MNIGEANDDADYGRGEGFDAVEAVRSAIRAGVANSAHVHRLTARIPIDVMVEEIIDELISPSKVWALEVLWRQSPNGGGA